MRILKALPMTATRARAQKSSRLCLLVIVLSLMTTFLNACSLANLQPRPTNLLGPRLARAPQQAVEAYLQHYQPGPLPRLFQTTRVYDRNGALLGELFSEGRRTWVTFDEISPTLIDATIATEDASFYTNRGIDPVRIVTAILRNAKNKQVTSGASTITMQLARNLFMGADQRYDQSVDRKLLEAGLAQELTKLYSKNELLEMYLNLLNYGNLTYGPEAAAHVYFGKTAHELTRAEAAFLAGIPQAPAKLDPYTNFAAVKQRQRTVLDLMVRHDKLTQAEADAAFAEKLVLKPDSGQMNELAPHFVQYVIETLDSRFGTGYTRRAGLNIDTTLDLTMQKLAQQIVTKTVGTLRPQYDLSNAALVAMRPNSGEILAMVGSADFHNTAIAGQVNVAVRLRQPGSAIKPILYATAISDTLISPATVLWDVPVKYPIEKDKPYEPRNYDNRFHGPVTARTALANSYNVPTVKLLAGLGIARMLESAHNMGIQSLRQGLDYYGLSLTLGGGEVTLLDLTTAYHTLASDGQYLPATPFLLITNSQNQKIELDLTPHPKQVIDPDAAFIVTDILSDNEARTPAFGAQSVLKLSRPAAAKTGTTNDFRDNWTLGYTRYLVAGVWAGNSDGHPMQHTSGITGAAPIWHNFMEAVLADPHLLSLLNAPADPQAWQFTPPSDVQLRLDCPPGIVCRKGGEFFTKRWLDITGSEGPLVDSVELTATAPVYVHQGGKTRQAGFCTVDQAAPHTVLRMAARVGLPPAFTATLSPTQTLTQTAAITVTPVFTPTAPSPQMVQEQQQIMAWSLRYSTAVNLGRCADLPKAVPQALALSPQAGDAGLRFTIDLTAARKPAASAPTNDNSKTINVKQTLAAAVPPGLHSGTYVLAPPIVNDANCPGAYIIGRVINWEGGPVAGVHVHLRDQWGNQADAISKSGSNDYGMFDFPIPSTAPHELYLTVMDGAGNLVSPTFTIQHKQGAAGDAPCHHVVLQGG